ncbi:MAG: LysM peptidoglycan-binding domain-containing protein [Scardovia wiggsiae]|uniref:LysM peptidoglycan-binding domain-containing protein n=1 Tax=Scardovia wiggsiae TaxID=230143 RepID=UPI001CB049ED|nr:LysM peptidoglycan-binding domain-containing protein [Scardovia wiggsiae]MBF1674557.1 LysM peptidoglycan-binding domain-containing protein [Scardovia wiggsiae]
MAGVITKRAISPVSVTGKTSAAVRTVRPSAARKAVPRLTVFSASVAGMIIAAVAAVGFMFMRPVQAQAQIESTAPMEVQSYVVGSGDTLWKYAQIGMKPGDNINDYVTYLMKLNHLDSADLTPGQRIIVPRH